MRQQQRRAHAGGSRAWKERRPHSRAAYLILAGMRCPSGDRPHSTPCLPHLRGWLLNFPPTPGTLDCLLVRDISYPGGVVPSFRQCHRGTGQFAGTEGPTVVQISRKAEWTSGRDPGGCSHLPAAPPLACAGERDPQGRQGR